MKKLILLPLLLISLFSFSQPLVKMGIGFSNGLTNDVDAGYQFTIKDAPYEYQASLGVIYIPAIEKSIFNIKYGVLLNDHLNVHAGMGLVNHTRVVDNNFRVSAYGTPILGAEYNFIPKKPYPYNLYTGLDFFDLSMQLKFGIKFIYKKK